MVYISLIRTQGEKTPSAGLESWRNPTSPFHWELGLRSLLAANTNTHYYAEINNIAMYIFKYSYVSFCILLRRTVTSFNYKDK